jgi:LmbE family N-acetylglucosaminyl deacetylase
MNMNPYLQYVEQYARLLEDGQSYPLGDFDPLPRPQVASHASKVLIFSPHPDDEVVIGGLALRLLRESRWNVVNVAVTHGSNRQRQPERLEELRRCCECIGFSLVQTAPNGLDRIHLKARTEEPAHWARCVATIAEILARHQPRVILFPHAADWNTAHIGTHFLVKDALERLPDDFECYTVETEFWGQNPAPNLMVEMRGRDLADLITALTFHVGEVRRNPYHLTLPAWMIDNVRRGAELVGGQGGGAPDFAFAILYRLRRWADGKLADVFEGGRYLSRFDQPEALFV